LKLLQVFGHKVFNMMAKTHRNSNAMKSVGALEMRLLSFSWVDSVRRSAYCDDNKPATPLVRTAHQGGCFFCGQPSFRVFRVFRGSNFPIRQS
jgi:hypothetical protein